MLPVIEESERADLRAATTHGPERWPPAGPSCAVALVHGRLKAEERDDVMRRFRAGEIHVLVATTVIEVGIDVPNATIMVIEHPERFGLAQLHQLRGRIGRGAEESYCILLAEGRAADRLTAFAATTGRLPDRGAGSGGARDGRPDRGPADRAASRCGTPGCRRMPTCCSRPGELAMRLIAADPALQRAENQRLRERAVARYPQGGRAVPDRLTGEPRCRRSPTRQSAVRSRSPASGSALPARMECCPACRCDE